jgi:hypothetical protein
MLLTTSYVALTNLFPLQEFGSNSLNLDSAQQEELLAHVFTLRSAASMAISQPVTEVLNVSGWNVAFELLRVLLLPKSA